MVRSPYENLPAKSFWKSGVSETTPNTVEHLWPRKFTIAPGMKVATAGSCFAQHIARFLRQRGCEVIDAEPPPPGLDLQTAQSFGYLLYSARYANIYSVRQLLQLAREAYSNVPSTDCVWEKGGRFYDAFRPSIEPNGLKTPSAVIEHRREHLARVRTVLDGADVFVFTMGLTEAWINRTSGSVYPTAPGTIAGDYDPSVFAFKNFTFGEIYDDFVDFRTLLKQHNPDVRILVTVSPVPLTATATDKHVLVATTYSKSVLRAVAGQLSDELADIDYFPSYELIASPFSRAEFYEDNLRAVREEGVRSVMRVFFGEPPSAGPTVSASPSTGPAGDRPRRKGPGQTERGSDVAGPATPMSDDSSAPNPVRLTTRKARRRARKMEMKAAISTGSADKASNEAKVVCEEVLLEAFSR